MPTTYILINADSGYEKKLLKQLREIENVKEAFLVYGTFDIISKVYTESLEELRELISSKIRKMDNVVSTITLIVAD